MGQSEVTVICTSYNYANYISQALDSFLNQETSFAFDILVVDDCSTDNSWEILKSYQKQFPDKIRLVRNSKNLGLTRTWIEICKQVSAKYLARCDADDYWIDSRKLQKQYDLLESDPNSKWCNTEFNIIDEEGYTTHSNVFANGPIAYANTYEKMIATKGMTLPSSWMVETDLMQEVNAAIDPDSVDDGFPMQLEFYRRTQLSFIAEPMVAYRMAGTSDSRPSSVEKMEKRIDGLLATQLHYLEKYKNMDMQKIAVLQANHDAMQEKRVFHMNLHIRNLENLVESQKKDIDMLNSVVTDLRQGNEALQMSYNEVVGSRRWTIPTKIISFFKRR